MSGTARGSGRDGDASSGCAGGAGGGPAADGSGARGGLPRPLLRFVERVNSGAFWESHEALEEAWREQGSGFYHGLILYASAFVHARRGTRHGIRAQLEKAEVALEPFAPSYLGVDVAGVLAHARRCRELAEVHEHPPAGSWEEAVPFPRLELDADRVRGDEPELCGSDASAPPRRRGGGGG